ncbi:hypothetical protein J2D73_20510, partial [Acetobacter sacchari]
MSASFLVPAGLGVQEGKAAVKVHRVFPSDRGSFVMFPAFLAAGDQFVRPSPEILAPPFCRALVKMLPPPAG